MEGSVNLSRNGVAASAEKADGVWSPAVALDRLGNALPFSAHDATAGSENELQVVVQGSRDSVDLPLAVATSNYFSNIVKRTAAGESARAGWNSI
jgi:hypothetical protein